MPIPKALPVLTPVHRVFPVAASSFPLVLRTCRTVLHSFTKAADSSKPVYHSFPVHFPRAATKKPLHKSKPYRLVWNSYKPALIP